MLCRITFKSNPITITDYMAGNVIRLLLGLLIFKSNPITDYNYDNICEIFIEIRGEQNDY